MGNIKKISTLDLQPPSPPMPTAQELKRAHEALDAQIAAAEQKECEAEEARLRAEEEARVAAEMAWLEEEVREWECALEEARQAKEAWARAAEEVRKQESDKRRRRRTSSWRSGVSARRGGLPGRGHHDDGYSCRCRTPPEVRRRRRG